MSKDTEAIKEMMDKLINAMKESGKEPESIHITKDQYSKLQNEFERRGKKHFKPRYRGYEIKST